MVGLFFFFFGGGGGGGGFKHSCQRLNCKVELCRQSLWGQFSSAYLLRFDSVNQFYNTRDPADHWQMPVENFVESFACLCVIPLNTEFSCCPKRAKIWQTKVRSASLGDFSLHQSWTSVNSVRQAPPPPPPPPPP